MWRLVALAAVCGCFTAGDNVVPPAPQLKITAGDALRTTETGGTASFTVGFDVAPLRTVPVILSSTNTKEGAVMPAAIQLGPDDFDGVLVTVTGVDDDDQDGDQAYAIHVDAGPLGQRDVDITNEDDDSSSGGANVVSMGSTTTEAGGVATFTVVLTAMPNADVHIPLASSNNAEGTVSASELTFTMANWNQAQTVTVTGQNDFVDDGDKPYNAVLGPATSSDSRYAGMNPNDVALTNVDDDTRGVTMTAMSGSTDESGTTATFTVALASRPLADVTITIASSDSTEGAVTPGSITFTNANWNVAQMITITGVDDVIDDGDITYPIVLDPASSADATYSGFDPPEVSATNVDDDGAGIGITAVKPLGYTTPALPMVFDAGQVAERHVQRVSKLVGAQHLVLDLLFAELGFAAALDDRVEVVLPSGTLAFVSKATLVRMKRLAGRPIDQQDLVNLGVDDAK